MQRKGFHPFTLHSKTVEGRRNRAWLAGYVMQPAVQGDLVQCALTGSRYELELFGKKIRFRFPIPPKDFLIPFFTAAIACSHGKSFYEIGSIRFGQHQSKISWLQLRHKNAVLLKPRKLRVVFQ